MGVGVIIGIFKGAINPGPPMPSGGTPEPGIPYVGEDPGYYFGVGIGGGETIGGGLSSSNLLDAGVTVVDMISGDPASSEYITRYTKVGDGYHFHNAYFKNNQLEPPSPFKIEGLPTPIR
jgi:hypothetical protein